MDSYLDRSDTGLLTLVGRRDIAALGELFGRYGTVVLIAADWTSENAAAAERVAVAVFLDVWARPEAYVPVTCSTRSHLVHAALRGQSPDAVRRAAPRLARLAGWTYHDVAEALGPPARRIASLIREQLAALRREVPPE